MRLLVVTDVTQSTIEPNHGFVGLGYVDVPADAAVVPLDVIFTDTNHMKTIAKLLDSLRDPRRVEGSPLSDDTKRFIELQQKP